MPGAGLVTHDPYHGAGAPSYDKLDGWTCASFRRRWERGPDRRSCTADERGGAPAFSRLLSEGRGGTSQEVQAYEQVFQPRSGGSPRARRRLDLAGLRSRRPSPWRPARSSPSRSWRTSPSWRWWRLARFASAWTALGRSPDHRAGRAEGLRGPAPDHRPRRTEGLRGGNLSGLRPARRLRARLLDHPAGRADAVGMAQGRHDPHLPRPVASPITAKRRPAEADLGLSSPPGTTRQRTGFVLCRAVAMPLRCSRPPRAFPP